MGSEETVWLLGIDGSEALGTLEEIISALGDAKEAIGGFVAAAADLSSLDAAFANISTAITDASTSATDLDEAMAQMSSTIAEDTAIIDGLNETVANLEAQLAALTGSEDEAAAGAGGLGSIFSSIQGTLSNVGEGFTGLLGNMGEGIQGFMGGIGDVVGGIGDFADSVFMGAFKLQMFAQMAEQVGSALVTPAATLEQTKVAFTTLMHSAAGATDELQKLNTFAAQTPFQTDAIDQAAEKMLAFGFSAKDVQPDITAIGDSLSALGEATSAQLSGVVDIFGKIEAQGKLSAANMHELAVRGIPAWQMLSEVMGKPVPELQKMVSKGAIPADKAIEALRQGMEKTFGGGMATQAGTFNGLMSTLQSNAKLAMAAFVGPVMKEAESGLSGIAAALASPGFQSFATGVGAAIAHIFQDIGNFVQTSVAPAIAGMVKAFGSPSFQSFAGTVGKGISLALHDIGDIGKNVVEPAIKGVVGVLTSPQFADFAKKMGDLGTQLNSVLMPAITGVKPIFEALFSFIQNTALPAAGGLAGHLADVIKWFKDGGTPAQIVKDLLVGIGVAIGAIGIGAFVLAVPGLIGGFIAWGIAAGGAAIATLAATWPILAIGAAIALLVTGIILAVQHWGQIVDWLKGVWGGISKFFQGLWGDITKVFQGIGGWFKDRFTDAWNAVTGAFGHIGQFLMGLWDDEVQGWKNIGQWFKDRFTDAWNMVTSVFQHIGQFLMGLWDREVQGWKNIGGWFHDRFTEAWNSITGVFGSIGKWFQDNVWQKIVDGVTTLKNDAANWGHDMIQNFINGISGMITNIGNAASNIASAISSHLHFSKPDIGPLADADTWMPDFGDMLTRGLRAQIPKLQASALDVASTFALTIPNPPNMNALVPNTTFSGGSNDQQNTQYLAQIAQGIVQLNSTLQQGQHGNLTMNNTFGPGGINQQQIAQALQVIFGFGYESQQRGVG
jgi:tape measure domain-containing protein